MLPFLIEKYTGYTIDHRYPEGPCPRCGSPVYHVREDNYIVYCTGIFCRWHDETFHSKTDL